MASPTPAAQCSDGPSGEPWLAGLRHMRRVSPESTGGAYALTECVAPRDCRTPYHVHHGDDEAFYVLEGELSFHLRDGSRALAAGGLIHLPRDTPHAFVVESEQARFLVLAAPGGCDDFFEQAIAKRPAGAALVSERGVEILGPPPRPESRNTGGEGRREEGAPQRC